MATVIFYEKPGCVSNAKQKAMLVSAGHQVIAHNILSEPWTAERLRAFFNVRPLPEWFNSAAPRIKSGEVVPEQLDEAGALALMLVEPLLIRRPLLQVENRCEAGFDPAMLDQWIGLGLAGVAAAPPSADGLEVCSKPAHAKSCTTTD